MQIVILALVSLLTQGSVTQKPNNEYVVGVKDVLQVTVRGFEDYSLERAVVDADGTIEHPQLGRINVAGKTEREIEEEMKSMFLKRQILTKVSMVVTVKEFRSQNIYVFGDGIRNPGMYPVRGDADILYAIGAADGFSAQAGAEVIIARGQSSISTGPKRVEDVKPEDRITILRQDLEMGRAPKIYLRDGDTIFVPKAQVFFVSGLVKSPGEFILRQNLTVGKAIDLAGGYQDRAAKGRVEIERMVNGKLEKHRVKESDLVKANDRILVPSRWW
jgi:polysaccharide export outer membrane protein